MFDLKSKYVFLSTAKHENENENNRCLSIIYEKNVLNDVSISDDDDNNDGNENENLFYEKCLLKNQDTINKEKSFNIECSSTPRHPNKLNQNNKLYVDNNGVNYLEYHQPIPMMTNTVSIINSLNLRNDKSSLHDSLPLLRNLFMLCSACAQNTTTHSVKHFLSSVAKKTNSLASIDGNNDGDTDSITFNNINIQDENNETITTREDTAKLLLLLKCLIYSQQSSPISDESVKKHLLNLNNNKIDLCTNRNNNNNNNNLGGKSCENFDKKKKFRHASSSNKFESSSRLKRLENNYNCAVTKLVNENLNGKLLDKKSFNKNENFIGGVNYFDNKGVYINHRIGEFDKSTTTTNNINNNKVDDSFLFISSFTRSKLPSSCFYFRNGNKSLFFNDLFFHHLNSFAIDSKGGLTRRHRPNNDKIICGTRLQNTKSDIIFSDGANNDIKSDQRKCEKEEEEDELSAGDLSSDSEEVCKVLSGVNIDKNENELCDTNTLRDYVLTQNLYPNCEFDANNFQNYQFNINHNYIGIISCYDELMEDDLDSNCNDDFPDNDFHFNVKLNQLVGENNKINNKLKNLNENNQNNNKLKDFSDNKIRKNISPSNNQNNNNNTSSNSNNITINKKLKMRESAGQLRGLLKKPNRPPTHRKNRVVFDETKNEFFDADYIILIREDCPYDEEDEEPCTCGEHELVRLCCDEGCQCPNYSSTSITQTAAAQSQNPVVTNEDGRTPQSPKFAPPIEFVDQATLSPPEGYKDNGSLTNALGGALGGHVFGAQHIQQLQVIQRLQQQRAAMLAARNTSQQQITGIQQQAQGQAAVIQTQNYQNQMISQTVCTECAECAECAVKQQMVEEDVESPCSEDISTLEVPHVALVPLQTTSPERRITQKEIIAGEERPKYMVLREPPPGGLPTTATVVSGISEQLQLKIVQQSYEVSQPIHYETTKSTTTTTTTIVNMPITQTNIAGQITGILKGGKLWKSETTQCDDITNVTSDEEGGSKRSVRFNEQISNQANDSILQDICEEIPPQNQPTEEDLANAQRPPLPAKKHTSSIFHNALRPNSAVRQLFPAAGTPATKPAPPPQGQHNSVGDADFPAVSLLTHETLRAFEEAKRNTLSKTVQMDSETDTIKRTIERNALRRSLIKYEPKKKPQRVDTSLEERIRKLTCDIDEPINNDASVTTDDCDLQNDQQRSDHLNANNQDANEAERRNSPAGEEVQSQCMQKYFPDKTYSPSSSASSSSSGSTSAYRKITEIFNRERRQERIPEADENSIVIIPQPDCRCPAAPDLGMGIQMPPAHTQIHQTPPRQNESKRQFLSTLVPLTSCVAGQRDDFSYYTLAPGERGSTASSQLSEYSLADIDSVLHDDVEIRKVAPDVIAGTPGQESDELTNFAQQEALRTEKLKKKYSGENVSHQPNSGDGSDDDDEQNDYGFNRRPSVRGIKPRFGSTNEILQQMQNQLSQTGPIETQQVSQSHVQNNPSASATQSKQVVNPQINNNGQVPATTAKQQITAAHHQHTTAWAYYPEMQSRVPIDHTNANYYHINPAAAHPNRHLSYHHDHHEEATIYQNCHTVSVEQHHYGHFARSPTRRPESPPPLRNYHQTMVLIPYSTEPYAHYATNDQVAQQFQRHNVLEYQQVTQQTIRVPMGYPLPGMQLHVVAGRGNSATTNANYSQTYSRISGRNYQNQYSTDIVKFGERGAPEGAASSILPSDCNNVMSPTTAQPNNNLLNQPNSTQTSTNNIQNQHSSAVFYAMNV